ncbi:hypothetical protein ACFL1D_03610 [Candidatus Omnitrophota bacterium]
MSETKKVLSSVILSIISLAISITAIYLTWQNLIFTNRPYIRISPTFYADTGKLYRIEKVNPTKFNLYFKVNFENVGSVPANDIHGEYILHWIFVHTTVKGLNAIKEINESLPDNLYVVKFGEEGMGKEAQEYLEQLPEEFKKEILTLFINKEIVLTSRLNDTAWKVFSLFPGENFEFESKQEISGKKAYKFIENIDKLQCYYAECRVNYYGILPEIGRRFNSVYNVNIISGKLIPLTISYR